MFLRKYNTATHIYIPIPKAGSANHAASGDWTPSAGDVKISKDGGAASNVTNLPTAIAMGNSTSWDFSLTSTEMSAAQVVVTVADSATKAVDDTGFVIETYGNASAQHPLDLGTALSSQTVGTATTLTNAPSDSPGVTTLLSRFSAARAGYLDNLSAGAVALASTFAGITKLAEWLGAMAGKQASDATAQAEMRATGAGSGSYSATTDSQEALRDRGDAAWTTATGFSTHTAADVWAVGTRTLTAFGFNVSIAVGGIPSGAHAAAELNLMADAFLDRNMATGTDSGTDSTSVRTVRQAFRRLRNKEAIVAGIGTVYKEDDATPSFTYGATTAAGDPLSAVDPT